MFLIALTCGRWAWCPTFSSGVRTPDSSMLLPSSFCTPLREPERRGKDEAINECGGMSQRQRLDQSRDNSHLHWLNSPSNALYGLDMAVSGCVFRC